MCRDGRTDKVV